MDTNWLVEGVPALALVLAGSGLGYLWLASRTFERKWRRHASGR